MSCIYNNDCHGYGCGSGLYPQCANLDGHSRCLCEVCTEHSHCLCPQGLIGQCHFDYIHNYHRCICGLAPDTTIKTTSTTVATTSTTTKTTIAGIQCPTCDETLNCVWNQTCYPEESCMIRSRYQGTKFTTHCTRKEDCSFIKNLMHNGEVFCCNDRVCLQTYLGV
ncbi:uncharacterized protein LOC134260917 isoform X2 [Saccostrea cucullata]|uniref:uncharacterized protein LOC134260917 isoform X2 n=1 Tax=Saccostrea cuccullata TaxID=36930 RepID=UPI002ED36645